MYDSCNSATAAGLQRIEVRSFGYLLEELLERIEVNHAVDCVDELGQLQQLCDACLTELASLRPLFAEIEQVLARLLAKSLLSI